MKRLAFIVMSLFIMGCSSDFEGADRSSVDVLTKSGSIIRTVTLNNSDVAGAPFKLSQSGRYQVMTKFYSQSGNKLDFQPTQLSKDFSGNIELVFEDGRNYKNVPINKWNLDHPTSMIVSGSFYVAPWDVKSIIGMKIDVVSLPKICRTQPCKVDILINKYNLTD